MELYIDLNKYLEYCKFLVPGLKIQKGDRYTHLSLQSLPPIVHFPLRCSYLLLLIQALDPASFREHYRPNCYSSSHTTTRSESAQQAKASVNVTTTLHV